jgi:hypothetical protein
VQEVLADRGTGWPGREAFLQHVLPRQHAANVADKAALIRTLVSSTHSVRAT